MPRLSSVTVQGSSDVDADFTGADEVAIEIDGSGDVTGTSVSIELEGRYQKGRGSVDEFLELTAIANPHAKVVFVPPAKVSADDSEGSESGLDFESREPNIKLGMFDIAVERAFAFRLPPEAIDVAAIPALHVPGITLGAVVDGGFEAIEDNGMRDDFAILDPQLLP